MLSADAGSRIGDQTLAADSLDLSASEQAAIIDFLGSLTDETGYFGAAKRLCDAFITKGSNVELPVNTPIFLRLDSSDPSVALTTR